jgi:4-alpha-glucanotransferase
VESLLAALKALGAPVAAADDVPSALRERRQSLYERIIEPVTVVRDGEPPAIQLCFPSKTGEIAGTGRLEMESGESLSWKLAVGQLPVITSADVEGQRYVVKRITLPVKLPSGYHKFVFRAGGKTAETMIISAPRKAYSPPEAGGNRGWGAFLPLYALTTRDGWGSGDYSGLGTLTDWVAERGGQAMGTLPLLPVFLDKTFEPSPYAPISRRLWNEFYVDVTAAKEMATCASAREMINSAPFRMEIREQQEKALVDYRTVMSLKRRVMEELSRHAADSPGRLDARQRFLREHQHIEEYARFRAVMERYDRPWTDWPPPLRDGPLKEGDYDEKAADYHRYAQWLAHQQVEELSVNARRKGVKLYFDLPVGVHPFGYDVWRHRDSFARNAEMGAPPDAVFTSGQNWWSPPLHPEKIREQHYGYVIEYLRHHLKYGDILRIDHVMGLHRLFWIPRGSDAGDGVYVRYRAEEMYAILALESHRHKNVIVGEDLGIVPSYVRPAMALYGLSRMYILYYELTDDTSKAFGHVPRNTVASLNTHDMPPFAAFWEDKDIPENEELGLLDEPGARKERQTRRATKNALTAGLRKMKFLRGADAGTRAVLKACLAYLSQSPARTVLVNLEDLWLETRSQNVPGTGDKYPSWQRKARYLLEDFCRMKDVRDILEMIGGVRKEKRSPSRRQ